MEWRRGVTRARQRAAAGEAIFRDVNERVAEIDRAHGIPTAEVASFLCECADSGCLERVVLTIDEYEAVRANPTHFVLLPGHEDDELERVIRRSEGHVVVEKTGEAADVARKHDPRDE
jgi:hypothetical protein